jgi:hypothetical protein
MPDFPWSALTGLMVALAAYLWWLHRNADRDEVQTVPSISLWDEAGGEDSGHQTAPVSLWWVARVAICALIIAAITGTAWPARRSVEEVWIDITPSLATREGASTRLQLAAAEIAERLRASGAKRVRLIAAQDADVVTDALEVAPDAILAGLNTLMSRIEPGTSPQVPDEARWLFSDGSAPYAEALAASLDGNVISAGAETENVGITAISARRSLLDPERMLVLVEIANAGREPAGRRVTLTSGGQEIENRDIALAPGATGSAQFTLPVSRAETLTAELYPSDSLAADDSTSLSAASLRAATGVRASSGCGRGIRQAVSVMADVRFEDRPDSMTISCGIRPDPTAALRLWTGGMQRAAPPYEWSTLAGDSLKRLDLSDMEVLAADSAPGDMSEKPILTAGRGVLATVDSTGVDIYFDLSRSAVQRDERFPLLLRGFIELAAGRELTTAPRTSRSRAALSIAPKPLESLETPRNLPPYERADLTGWFIVMAAALLAADLRRGLRDGK